MTRISYLNGEFLPHENCFIHIEDRGFQFADGAYEVTFFKDGKLVDGDPHIDRLFRSLNELNIKHDLNKEDLKKMQIELFAKNNMSEGICYINVTRGFHKRIPSCPKEITPTINATVSTNKKVSLEEFDRGFEIMTHEDIRWKRCDIKSVALLPSTLINQKAKDSGFSDAVFVRDGFVTEGTFANAFIVDENDNLITRAPDNFILCGITRNRLISIAKEKGINVIERSFTVDEMLAAKEVFLTSSSLILRPISKIDGKVIADGRNRKIAKILKDAYDEFVNP